MRLLSHLFALVALLVLAAQPLAAQSVLRDAETEAFLDEIAAPLVEAAGLEPGNVEMVLINDPSLNAFVAGGQAIYLHSGLIDAADSANEVQGVIAHELGHITGGHINRIGEGYAKAGNISLLSMLAGIGAALAGSTDAAMGLMMAGQSAALSSVLSFTRTQEASADAAGAEYLSRAGISGRGSLSFFGKLLNMEMRRGFSQDEEAGFWRTHPLSGDRISTLRGTYEKDPAWNKPSDPALEARFQRVKAKLMGYVAKPEHTLRDYPESDTSTPALVARAYAYHKQAKMERALGTADLLIERAPADPYFLELKGQVLLESGRPDEALTYLREATTLSRAEPLIASLFGHALIATEDETNYEEAERVLRASVGRDRYNPFAWYQLGVVYAARGDMPRARLASAEQQVMKREYALAMRSAQAAEAGLPVGSPDWLRAQDIGMQARALLEQQCEMSKDRSCRRRR
ncbi:MULTISPECIES: M48 family metalloprotease [Qipengyuania]|uniref:Putative Zn-dependent protease, contains TPR repeats n=1 Tax=Qipengyuania nanhaisediminis TaxID=604088 RepID=A0A1I5KRQ8_9SPHN|nr:MULTISPECIES: M48 family metalloprotease [Qipengyuania]MCA0903380.1 M48 family metalloprotease [Qipengyuania aquimaris]SFO87603.1 Putative Zn-dependent protease, contains TPR repeats [Qipengyuania nanhaisediminis]